MKIYDQFEYKGLKVTIQESSIYKGNQFKCIVHGKIKISLGCLETENLAKEEAIRFIDSIKSNKKGV
jgi:hypothetical protein